ncbi:MAG: hypothetical protein GY810_02235 [Aureispira sp.]|nr:hypothetical protein [Aureispira sp.]
MNWINPEYGAGAGLFFFIELLLGGPILDSKYVKPYIERQREKFGITRTRIVLTSNQVISKKKNIPLHKVTDIVYSQHSNYSRSNNFEEEIYCKLILRWSGVPVSYHINTEEEAKELAQKIKELID